MRCDIICSALVASSILFRATTVQESFSKAYRIVDPQSSLYVRADPNRNFPSTRLAISGGATEVRDTLFHDLEFTHVEDLVLSQTQFPKIASVVHASSFKKLFQKKSRVSGISTARNSDRFIFYQEANTLLDKSDCGFALLR